MIGNRDRSDGQATSFSAGPVYAHGSNVVALAVECFLSRFLVSSLLRGWKDEFRRQKLVVAFVA